MYKLVHFYDVPAQSFGEDPKKVDVRFYRDQLGMAGGGMTVMKLAPGITTYGHRHKRQEEVFLLISGQVAIKLEEKIIRLKPYDAVRVPKETARSLRNVGKTGAIIIAFGTPNTGPGDGINIENFWD
jgi:mannose-6-phosphate isomerase-like protein (cupin superfamily)